MQVRFSPTLSMGLLAALAILFFAGGLALQYEAADHGPNKILQNKELTEIQLKAALDFQIERVRNIQQSANAAFDISKICLGALVAVISQAAMGKRERVGAE